MLRTYSRVEGVAYHVPFRRLQHIRRENETVIPNLNVVDCGVRFRERGKQPRCGAYPSARHQGYLSFSPYVPWIFDDDKWWTVCQNRVGNNQGRVGVTSLLHGYRGCGSLSRREGMQC